MHTLREIRRRLSYANVASTLAVFLLLGGATALAAHGLGKHSVGARQLRTNAVTAAKLKRNSVTTRKIKKNAVTGQKIGLEAVATRHLVKAAVTGEKIAANTVTGVNIDAPSTPFSRLVAQLRSSASVSLASSQFFSLGSYTQAAGEDDQYLGGVDVTFRVGCEPPRRVEAILRMDVADPSNPQPSEIVGEGAVEDGGTGTVTRRIEFGPALEEALHPMSKLAPAAATGHTFWIYLTEAECASGGGVTASGASVDVLGTR